MDKILVTIYVLATEEEYDILIPINITGIEALNLIQTTIKELSSNNYEINNNAVLFNEEGKLINLKNSIKFSGLKNGSKVLLK